MSPDEFALRVFYAGGEVYYEARACAGATPTPVFWGFAVDAGLSPCGKCAASFEEVAA
jgi:hypothetical protein